MTGARMLCFLSIQMILSFSCSIKKELAKEKSLNKEFQVIEVVIINDSISDIKENSIREIVTIAVNNYNNDFPVSGEISGSYHLQVKKQFDDYYVNALCNIDEKAKGYLHSEIIKVSDGGNCYFNLIVDVDSSSYFDFRVNGR